MLYSIKQVKRLKIRNQRVAGSSPVVSINFRARRKFFILKANC